MIGLVLLVIAGALGLLVFRFALNAGWHWGAAVGVGVVPVVFTFFMGLIGLLVGVAFTTAMWRALD